MPPDQHPNDLSRQRIYGLEGLRGLAAISVVIFHSILAYFPERIPVLPGSPDFQGVTYPYRFWFGLVYGSPAVTLFFVLSGFVLTRQYLQTINDRVIIKTAFKRWFRLAGPVAITTVLSWLLFEADAYRFAEAGNLTGSPWLKDFGNVGLIVRHSLLGSFFEGAFFTFFRGDAGLDSSLWTMKIEFFGSFMSFGLALLLARLEARILILFFVSIVTVLCAMTNILYCAFPIGVGAAKLLPPQRPIFPGWAFVALILVALYAFGYSGSSGGDFAPLASILFHCEPTRVHIAASVLIISVVIYAPTGATSNALSSNVLRWLGWISFPLYLVHLLVICSFGSLLILMITPAFGVQVAAAITLVATLPASLVAAYPLALFNAWWIVRVDQFARFALGRT